MNTFMFLCILVFQVSALLNVMFSCVLSLSHTYVGCGTDCIDYYLYLLPYFRSIKDHCSDVMVWREGRG